MQWVTEWAKLVTTYQPEPRHQLPHRRQCCRSVSGAAADDEVIGIIDNASIEPAAVAESLPGQQEATEVEIRQQGRDRGALRGPPISIPCLRCASGRALVTLDHGCCEPAFNHGQERAVRDTAAHAAHQRPVRDRREVVAEISVYHLRPPTVADGFCCKVGFPLR